MNIRDAADSAFSYAVGAVTLILSNWVETAHAITILLGVFMVGLRATYDFIKLYRYIKYPDRPKN